MSTSAITAQALRLLADEIRAPDDVPACCLRDAAGLIERQARAIAVARAEFGKIWPAGSACEHRHAAAGFKALEVADV